MITEVTVSPMGLGWESVGIHPRSADWVLNGFGADRDAALEDYQNRYRQERFMGLYEPYESEGVEVVEVNVDLPTWYVPEPIEEVEPVDPEGLKVDFGDL